MINRLIDLSLRNRFLVIALYLGLAAWGYWSLRSTPVDAIPDLSDNQVIVFTEWPGHAALEVEDQVTYPLTVNLQGLAGIRVVRSSSAFGFSMVNAIFEDSVDVYFARARVLERLNLVSKLLPPGVAPTLGPDATGVGHVFWYVVESEQHSLDALRSLQDWFIRYQLNSVPGVAEVASVGGHVQQYQIDVDPNRLRTFGLSLGDVVRAVQQSNSNVGGNIVESNDTWSIVRGVGLVESVADLGQIAIRASNGVPVHVGQVADVKVGRAFRVASLVKGTHEAVGGVVVARAGVNTQSVIDGVKRRLQQIEPGLPKGVRIVPFYDRSQLIERAVGTLRTTLVEEILLVTLAHVVFLLHLRSILIVTIPLPLAVLAAFLGMYYVGVSSNIMSLAGIAIAIGVLVDAGIVVTENAFRYVEQHKVPARDRAAVREAVRQSAHLVGRPVFFSMAIILLAFVPVFALTGQEGKLFHPLAFTKTFAVLAATVIAVTLVPVLCTVLLGGKLHPEQSNPVMRFLGGVYRPVLASALEHRLLTLGAAAVLLIGALSLTTRIGSEFMPPLDEGDLLFMPIADASISLEENTRIAARQNEAMLRFPEVESVVAKVGRADTSTDPSPLNMTETVVHLQPRNRWRPGVTLEHLRAEMSRATQLPGVTSIWTMPIVNRIDMLTTGVRSEVGIKVFGSDLDTLEALARRVADVVRTVPGAANVYPEPLTSGQYLDIRVNREAAARYGLTVTDVQNVIEYAIGETVVGTKIEGRQRFPIRVRYAPEFRANPEAIGETSLTAPNGASVPLNAVADIVPVRGPAMIAAENGLLLATVLLNVHGRDIGGFVREASDAVRRVELPAGYYIGWSGRYENQARAARRLLVVVPVVLLIIFTLLYFTYHSVTEAAHVLLAVPFALTGGLFLVWLLGYNFSVAVWVGFIALFGTAVQTAVVMVIYLEEAVERKRMSLGGALTREALRDAIMEGALLRLRPKLMTVSTVVASLLPIMWSTRVGADVMKPLAAPVLGGMISSLTHVLIVTPVLFCWIRERQLMSALGRALPETAEPSHDLLASGGRGFLEGLGPLVASRRALFLGVTGGLAILASAALLPIWLQHDTTTMATMGLQVRAMRSGDLNVSIVPADETLRQGRSTFWIEFRSATSDELVDAGTVRANATMPMPGMLMSGRVNVSREGPPGRYLAVAEFSMAGGWQIAIDWDGPAGKGSVSFEGDVQ